MATNETVRDYMTPDPVLCTPGTTPAEAAQLMRDNDTGALPVVENLNEPVPVGVVTDRDIVIRGVAEEDELSDMLVVDLMSAEPARVREDEPIDAAVNLFKDEKIRRVLVVNDRGYIVGIIAQADLARRQPERAKEVVETVSQPGGEQRPNP